MLSMIYVKNLGGFEKLHIIVSLKYLSKFKSQYRSVPAD